MYPKKNQEHNTKEYTYSVAQDLTADACPAQLIFYIGFGLFCQTAAYFDGIPLCSAVKMLPKNHAAKDVTQRLSSVLPSFQDIFDEESFYIFAFFITVLTCVGAFVASRYVTIKDAGHLD
ncbi:hypothetical protein EGW08_017164 [Elysia chlorotica]|uniref:Uncharacterized protein n=1 Tax=Elysia chlorotica TaxID=188477 RepID=A0A433T0P9_ELYCH|nr:hypothetical protein EGW08_017164 [Elysia chlorotica]